MISVFVALIATSLAEPPVRAGAGAFIAATIEREDFGIRQNGITLGANVPIWRALSAELALGHRVNERVHPWRLGFRPPTCPQYQPGVLAAWQARAAARVWLPTGEGTVAEEFDIFFSPWVSAGLGLIDRRHHVFTDWNVYPPVTSDTEVERHVRVGPRMGVGANITLTNGIGVELAWAISGVYDQPIPVPTGCIPTRPQNGPWHWRRSVVLGLVFQPMRQRAE